MIFYILATLFCVNATNINTEKVLNSISLRYENILAKHFEEQLTDLTDKMKTELVLDKARHNEIWNIYVQNVRDVNLDYQQILKFIKEKECIETDMRNRIFREYVGEMKFKEVSLNKHIIKNIIDYMGGLPEEVKIWLRKGVPLGETNRIQLIRHFNETMKNLLGDAAAFYFLYGPRKLLFMSFKIPSRKSGEVNFVEPNDFMKKILKQIGKESSTISQYIRKNFDEAFMKNLDIHMLKEKASFDDFDITYVDNGLFFGTIEYHYILAQLVNHEYTGYQTYGRVLNDFLESISFRYVKPLAESFEDHLTVLTKDMKKDIILNSNMDQNIIWKNYVKRIKAIRPDYEIFYDIISMNLEYTESDRTAQIFKKYLNEEHCGILSVEKRIIKNMVLHNSFTTGIVRKYITEKIISKFSLYPSIIQNIADYVGSFQKNVDDILLSTEDRVELGAWELRYEFEHRFNQRIKNVLADAFAFYFLYGPKQFMKEVENVILSEDDSGNIQSINVDDHLVDSTVEKLIEEFFKEASTISEDIQRNFKMTFLENLREIVLNTQTSLPLSFEFNRRWGMGLQINDLDDID